VLLAEDNSVNQKVAVRMLEKLGCSVDVAANGFEAVSLCGSLPYDLVLMDCQMPEMDGLQATSEIRAMESGDRRTPIVALTANVLPRDRELCLKAGMDDFVSKPVSIAALAAALGQWATKDSPGTGGKERAPDAAPIHDPRTLLEPTKTTAATMRR
jgi:CheY-like chemotaxis protein